MKEVISRNFSLKHVCMAELIKTDNGYDVSCELVNGKNVISKYEDELAARRFYESVVNEILPTVKNPQQ